MVIFTRMEVLSDNVTGPFGVQLGSIYRLLNLIPPIFKGRLVPSEIPNVQRWEIETEILSRPTGIPTAPIVYRKVYTTWETGLLLAKQEALSLIYEEYHQLLPQGSLHRRFGRHGANGLPH